MTRSNPGGHEAALSAAFARAVDLSALKRPAPTAAPAATTATATASDHVIDVSETTFGADVVERSMQVLVIVDLWAEWCQPCKQLTPLLERVVDSYDGSVVLAKVDVDANPRISQAFGVQSIPTVVAVAGGQPVDAFSGAQPESQVRAWVKGLVDALRDRLPGMGQAPDRSAEAEPDPLLEQAEEALEAGDFDAAIAAYQQITDADPGNTDALLALGQLQFQQRALQLPADAVERAAANPDDVPAQLDAADLLFAGGRLEEAMDLLIGVISRLPADQRTPVRDHLLELFAMLGQDDPLVVKSRRQLAAALY